jgi:hypothetical protein
MHRAIYADLRFSVTALRCRTPGARLTTVLDPAIAVRHEPGVNSSSRQLPSYWTNRDFRGDCFSRRSAAFSMSIHREGIPKAQIPYDSIFASKTKRRAQSFPGPIARSQILVCMVFLANSIVPIRALKTISPQTQSQLPSFTDRGELGKLYASGGSCQVNRFPDDRFRGVSGHRPCTCNLEGQGLTPGANDADLMTQCQRGTKIAGRFRTWARSGVTEPSGPSERFDEKWLPARRGEASA